MRRDYLALHISRVQNRTTAKDTEAHTPCAEFDGQRRNVNLTQQSWTQANRVASFRFLIRDRDQNSPTDKVFRSEEEVEAMDVHNVVLLQSESTLVMRHVSLVTLYWHDGSGAL